MKPFRLSILPTVAALLAVTLIAAAPSPRSIALVSSLSGRAQVIRPGG